MNGENYETVDELLNALYAVFGKGIRIKQWGDFWDTELPAIRLEKDPVTIVEMAPKKKGATRPPTERMF